MYRYLYVCVFIILKQTQTHGCVCEVFKKSISTQCGLYKTFLCVWNTTINSDNHYMKKVNLTYDINAGENCLCNTFVARPPLFSLFWSLQSLQNLLGRLIGEITVIEQPQAEEIVACRGSQRWSYIIFGFL